MLQIYRSSSNQQHQQHQQVYRWFNNIRRTYETIHLRSFKFPLESFWKPADVSVPRLYPKAIKHQIPKTTNNEYDFLAIAPRRVNPNPRFFHWRVPGMLMVNEYPYDDGDYNFNFDEQYDEMTMDCNSINRGAHPGLWAQIYGDYYINRFFKEIKTIIDQFKTPMFNVSQQGGIKKSG